MLRANHNAGQEQPDQDEVTFMLVLQMDSPLTVSRKKADQQSRFTSDSFRSNNVSFIKVVHVVPSTKNSPEQQKASRPPQPLKEHAVYDLDYCRMIYVSSLSSCRRSTKVCLKSVVVSDTFPSFSNLREIIECLNVTLMEI